LHGLGLGLQLLQIRLENGDLLGPRLEAPVELPAAATGARVIVTLMVVTAATVFCRLLLMTVAIPGFVVLAPAVLVFVMPSMLTPAVMVPVLLSMLTH
jgi:hypothetical protein